MSTEMHKVREDCAKQYGLNEKVIMGEEDAPDTKKCFYNCVYKEMHLMDDHGDITMDEYLKKAKLMKVSDDMMTYKRECATTIHKHDDPCDTAMELHKCVKGKMHH